MNFNPDKKIIFLKNKCYKYRKRNKALYILIWLIYSHYCVKYGVQIPAKVKIGEGFRIVHWGGIVINEYAVLGKNVKVLNGVLIGAESRGKRKGVPIIGDNVWIGSKATIVGNVKIGNNVLIASNSFVNFSVPDNSVVIGNPGKIIRKDNATEGYC